MNKLMEQKSITDCQIHGVCVQLKKFPELDAGTVLERSMLQILAVCPLAFSVFPEASAYSPGEAGILS